MIITRDGKEITAIYKQDGTEIEEVKDANGRILYLASREITGTSPLSFYSLGKPLTDYRISGETIQDGTPSPDMPVDVVGVGERTENLFDKDVYLHNGSSTQYLGVYAHKLLLKPNTTYTLSSNVPKLSDLNHLYITNYASLYPYEICYNNHSATVTTNPDGSIYFMYAKRTYYNDLLSGVYYIMLTEGSTPYGYKLPITVTNGTDTFTTPIYIGAEPLHRIGEYADYVDYASGKIVRRIKKLVLTGEEMVTGGSNLTTFFYGIDPPALRTSDAITAVSNCYIRSMNANAAIIYGYPDYTICFTSSSTPAPPTNYSLAINDGRFDYYHQATFRNYLKERYESGNPVIVWYVLYEPIEEDPPVPLPALPTLSGTNTMSVDTTVKPSQMYIKGKIKPDGYGNLIDRNGVYILDKDGVSLTVHGQGQ